MTVLLNLKIHTPEGELQDLEIDPSTVTGNMLKQRTHAIYRKRPDEQTLWFEMEKTNTNGANTNSSNLVLVDDRKTLGDHGITNNTIVREGRDLGKAKATDSELRRNIQDKENFSYYYAHANETPLPESTRYAYGGDPIPLGKTDLEIMEQSRLKQQGTLSPRQQSSLCVWRPVSQYSWTDDGDKVKIYISQPDVLALAQKDKEGISTSSSPPNVNEAEQSERDKGRYGPMDKFIPGRIGYIIQCALCPKGLEIRFRDPNQEKSGFKFRLGPFDSGKEIVHEQGKLTEKSSNYMTYKVTEKKITVTLKKVDGSLTWYDLRVPTGSQDGFERWLEEQDGVSGVEDMRGEQDKGEDEEGMEDCQEE